MNKFPTPTFPAKVGKLTKTIGGGMLFLAFLLLVLAFWGTLIAAVASLFSRPSLMWFAVAAVLGVTIFAIYRAIEHNWICYIAHD